MFPRHTDYTKKDADFNMDASSKYAEWEQRGQGTIGTNPHEGGEKPSGLDKAAGKLEEVTGKVMGDKELHARGIADQGTFYLRPSISDSRLAFSNATFDPEFAPSCAGKGTANKMQDLKTEAGGNVSYPDRV